MTRTDLLIEAGLLVSLVVMVGRGAPAQERSSAEQPVVVAIVDGEPILAGEVARLVEKVARGQEINPAVRPFVQARVLSEIVDRRLVMAYARRTKSAPGQSEVDAALSKLESRLLAQGRSLSDFLRERSIGRTELRRQIAWHLLWEKYLARYITEKRLASFFAANRREFDGTEVSVSHILLRPAPGTATAATDELVERAGAIRREITSGKTSFAEAAQRHSAGPSKNNGGKLGPIARRGTMGEAFSRAAFALEVGQLSRPVRTRFGVHLIRCDEIRPGDKQLSDVRKELEEALARELFGKLARLQRRHTPPAFTGKMPYFKPGTEELIVP